jgi:hypothetical protein
MIQGSLPATREFCDVREGIAPRHRRVRKAQGTEVPER